MPRPFAVTGLTLFFALSVLCCVGIRFCVLFSVLFILMFIITLFNKQTRSQRVLPVAAFAGVTACILFAVNYNLRYEPAVSLDGSVCNVTAVFKDSGSNRYERWYYEAQTQAVNGQNKSCDVTLVFKNKLNAQPNDRISGVFTFYKKESGSSLFKINRSSAFIGAYPDNGDNSVTVIPSDSVKIPLLYRLYIFRDKLKTNLKSVVSGENATLACALLFGKTDGFSDFLYSKFKAAGISHIICVSGLHLSLWAVFITKFLGRIKVKKRLREIVAALFVLFYMALTGFTFSVTRAGIMLLVVLLGSTLFRRGDSINSLGIAAIFILCKNPFAAGDTGFQLSFLATLGILLFMPHISEKINEKLKNKPGFLRDIIKYFLITAAACSCAFALTLPVMIVTFGEINLMSFAGNLLVVPVVSICMITAGLTAVLPFFGPLSFLKYPTGLVCSVCAKYINGVVDFLSQYRFLTFYPRRLLSFIWLGGALLITATALYFASKGKKITAVTPLVIAATFVSMLVVSDVFYSDLAEVTVIDNKNALCVLVTKGNYSALIGCGADYYSTAYGTCDELENRHIDRLNLLIVPGNKYGESGALNEVLSCVETDVLAYSEKPDYSVSLAEGSRAVEYGGRFSMQLCDGCRITVINDETGRFALIEANGESFAVVYEAEGSLPESDFLLCKKETALKAEAGLYKAILIAGEKGAVQAQNAVNNKGTFCAAAAGQGGITVSVSPDSGYKIYRQ